jgi:hypothetical protein
VEAKTAAAPAAPAVKEPAVKEDVPCRDRFSEGACKQRSGLPLGQRIQAHRWHPGLGELQGRQGAGRSRTDKVILK